MLHVTSICLKQQEKALCNGNNMLWQSSDQAKEVVLRLLQTYSPVVLQNSVMPEQNQIARSQLACHTIGGRHI